MVGIRSPGLCLVLCLSFVLQLSVSAPPPMHSEPKDGDMEILGNWASDPKLLAKLRDQFLSADPFPHVEIEGFFTEEVAAAIEGNFPKPKGNSTRDWQEEGWHVYDNPIEGKLANDDVESMARHHTVFEKMWRTLQSDKLVALLQKITDIEGLENDPHLHGAGLHYHPRGSRLEMHLDYSIHPVTKKERRVNLIVYMNKEWQDQWGGHLNLWEGTLDGMTKFARKVAPHYNRAVLFRTSDISWHGMPDPVGGGMLHSGDI
mmetsp:Transcript_8728/g.13851  ORF Transcript_8728/g.13851 Transcript_8728/m.13851 type:complete len:260 (+) Transcript_8728:116-895(+)